MALIHQHRATDRRNIEIGMIIVAGGSTEWDSAQFLGANLIIDAHIVEHGVLMALIPVTKSRRQRKMLYHPKVQVRHQRTDIALGAQNTAKNDI